MTPGRQRTIGRLQHSIGVEAFLEAPAQEDGGLSAFAQRGEHARDVRRTLTVRSLFRDALVAAMRIRQVNVPAPRRSR